MWGVNRFPVLFFAAGGTILVAVLAFTGNVPFAVVTGLLAGPVLFVFMLAYLRAKRLRKLEDQVPEAIDILVRSLRAGHPVPAAVALVSRELPDPIGTEFCILADELTYGLDLETAMNNMASRVGQEDLALLVVATGIQSGTGGNPRGDLGQHRESRPGKTEAASPGQGNVGRRAFLGRYSQHSAVRAVWYPLDYRAPILWRDLGPSLGQDRPFCCGLLADHR